MKAIVVYESMFGATRSVAEAVAEGLGSAGQVRVARAADVEAGALEGVDLLVVGAPTHAWSMPRPSTRQGAPGYTRKPGSDLAVEPGAATDPGVREWIESLTGVSQSVAAFDTRFAMPALLTGRASRAILRSLCRKGARRLVPAESFLVDKKSHLLTGQLERARSWGSELAVAFPALRARAA